MKNQKDDDDDEKKGTELKLELHDADGEEVHHASSHGSSS